MLRSSRSESAASRLLRRVQRDRTGFLALPVRAGVAAYTCATQCRYPSPQTVTDRDRKTYRDQAPGGDRLREGVTHTLTILVQAS